MSIEEQADIKRLLLKVEAISDHVESIDRGLYGDPKNKVPGLMQQLYETKEEVQVLKDKDKKRTWMIAGFSSAASLTLPVLWEWVKKHFGL